MNQRRHIKNTCAIQAQTANGGHSFAIREGARIIMHSMDVALRMQNR